MSQQIRYHSPIKVTPPHGSRLNSHLGCTARSISAAAAIPIQNLVGNVGLQLTQKLSPVKSTFPTAEKNADISKEIWNNASKKLQYR